MTGMDVYKKIAAILKRLYLCTNRAQIDELFIAENIFDYKERIELLQECMGMACGKSLPFSFYFSTASLKFAYSKLARRFGGLWTG